MLDSRKRRDGAYLANLGYYNPFTEPHEINIHADEIVESQVLPGQVRIGLVDESEDVIILLLENRGMVMKVIDGGKPVVIPTSRSIRRRCGQREPSVTGSISDMPGPGAWVRRSRGSPRWRWRHRLEARSVLLHRSDTFFSEGSKLSAPFRILPTQIAGRHSG